MISSDDFPTELHIDWHIVLSFVEQYVLRLRTICYIEPVLTFGTEQDIIVNSRRLSPQRSKDQAI
jgi:hypothetical protein